MSAIQGLRKAMQRLDRMDIEHAVSDSLEAAAQAVEADVRSLLSRLPGEDHATPWLRTGALRASIDHRVDGTVAVIGSTEDVAVDQELGTHVIPPRPFLAPAASAAAPDIVESIASSLRHRIDEQ